MRKIVWGMVMLASVSTVGCKGIIKAIVREVAEEADGGSSSGDEEADLSGPTKVVELEWPEDDKFQIPGEPEQYGDISVYEGTYQVTLHGMPKGSEFIVDGKTNKVDSDIFDIIKLKDMKSMLGGLKIAELSDARLDPELSAELRIPGKRAELKLPPARVMGLNDILEKVENTPIEFEGEPPKEGEGFSILSLSGIRPELFGKATLLQDVDGIAITRRLEAVKGTKKCTGYKDKNDKPVPDITLQLKETEAIIYDRRTSEIVAKKVFPPEDRCPMFSFGSKGDRTENSSMPTNKIEEWLRSQVKR